jgi:hypothetical protein
MHLTTDQIETEALSLPRADRARILDALMVSLEMDPEFEQAWGEEAHRRHQAFAAGELASPPAKEALAQLRKQITEQPV